MIRLFARPAAPRGQRNVSSWAWQRVALALLVPVLMLVAGSDTDARGGQQWFTGWAVSHGQRFTTPVLNNSSVRMIVRPTISGNSVRLKLENKPSPLAASPSSGSGQAAVSTPASSRRSP